MTRDAWEDSLEPCPYCGRDLPEDCPRCPYCERYVSDEDAPPARKPWWIILGALIAFYAAYTWIFGRGFR